MLSLTSFSVSLEVDWLVEEFLLVELLSKNIPISSRASLSSSVHVPFSTRSIKLLIPSSPKRL
uniref:Uncharacterized protein n=1 Tax=virus sp. ctrcb4 TaxID=2825824 RepID=A0A8S5RPX3_9VIRU|nr:MAG TPA: hypothetical protein [virus sp. ctrcb4]DAR12771.1 MAG TPA: hypothetical protein [Crassvirales sp.]